MRRLAQEEGGWALVSAMVLMALMATFALATSASVDNQQRLSAVGRQRETAFNLAEAALNAQVYALTNRWPGKGGATSTALAYPATCTQSSSDTRCPAPATLTALFASADTETDASWTTMIRDNSGATGAETFWTEGMTSTAPAYDANGDNKLWVRSQAIARGQRRTIVALVRSESQQEAIPHNTLLAGRVSISNNGHKRIIDTKGSGAITSPVIVRCTPTLGETTTCLGHQVGGGGLPALLSLLDIQILPNVYMTGYTGGAGLAPDSLERLRLAAVSDGTYYTSCPSSLTGAVVWVEISSTCSYTSNPTYNTAAAPGVLIVARGALTLAGTVNFNGLIYHANLSGSTGWLVQLGGNAQVKGGVIVDGMGGFVAGSSKDNVVFSDNAYGAVRSYGTAGLIQNTWRELKPTG